VYHGTVPLSIGSDSSFEKISDSEVVFSVSTDTFKEGNENYVRWSCLDSDGDRWTSQLFRVKVATNEAPEIRIIQPVDGGYSTLNPVIEAEFIDTNGIDIASIEIILKDGLGIEVLKVLGSDLPAIYDAETGILKYRVGDNLVRNNGEYNLKISATNTGYGEFALGASEEVSFTARRQGIADAVSYPNPFDPALGDATLRYVLSEDAEVTINIYDTSRNLVMTLIENEPRREGQNEDKWSGRNFACRNLSNGIYYLEFIAEGSKENRVYQTIAIFR
ncbi:MAG: hypothetical protein GX817_01865, partial [Elusimicrobia bacterium]|nr:hypothetical protein [Elusimicrobiota bacterium]